MKNNNLTPALIQELLNLTPTSTHARSCMQRVAVTVVRTGAINTLLFLPYV